ncbi:D-arabinono-1,4-lactone oxidase [Paenibacillus antarcticus]|uniref:FAD-binding oxidoreductase n=1 Tax=Paenibacillus antarcticus TaxID=253703 RepID=A0A168Q4E6_9BACL|nr:D-arabinono-1,4-lactone oxidase [Paenibacillus antarcticus]OAB47374.1 FAD-binding oxidoreductase [Paenibacillus antarcticus]
MLLMTERRKKWTNWSGSVTATPELVKYPTTIDEIVEIVHNECVIGGKYLRMVGSSHSFTPVAASDQVLVSLDGLQGIVSMDVDQATAVVWAGTKLKLLGELLHESGLAQENLGDIDVQSIAGAISTGTHGSGHRLGSIATQVIGITVVNGLGEVMECTEQSHPDVFKALQVSLGTLGIIVQVKLRLRKSYVLSYESKRMDLSDCLTQLPGLIERNRHFEFFWFPYAEACQVKLMNETGSPISINKVSDFVNERLIENTLFGLLSGMCRLFPAVSSTISRISASSVPIMTKANYSHNIFATQRTVRFNEMEYSLPADCMTAVIREMREAMEREKFHVHFPIECRYVAADDIWLSPAYGRDSAYIAVHMYRGMPYERYFQVMEEIFLRYEGRPHWGKMHTLKAADLKKRYPMWQHFEEIREQMDPNHVFLSPYMSELLEDEPGRTEIT